MQYLINGEFFCEIPPGLADNLNFEEKVRGHFGSSFYLQCESVYTCTRTV